MKRILLGSILLIGILFGTYQLMNSRDYQIFGNIASRVKTTKRVVALTFDDGPTEKTEDILNVLDELGVKATFFLTGNQIEQQKEATVEIVNRGHDIGNHSYSHQRNVFKSPRFIINEILKTNQLIKSTGYNGEIYFRSPYCKKLFILPYYLNKYEMTNVTFDIEPETYYDDIDEMVTYVLQEVQPGSIILMHPMYHDISFEAIKPIVENLKSLNFEFVTVSELMTYEEK